MKRLLSYLLNNKLKILILVAFLVLFPEVFKLVKSARINFDNRNACVKHQYNYYRNQKNLYPRNYTDSESIRNAYQDCK